MTTTQIILSIFELLLIAATITALFNENKVINFEKTLFKKIKNLWEVIR